LRSQLIITIICLTKTNIIVTVTLLSDVGEPGSGQFEFLLNGICLQ